MIGAFSKNTRFSTRIILFFSMMMVFLFIATLTTALTVFQSDKMSYVFDLQDYQTERFSNRLRALLEQKKEESENAKEILVENAFSYGLPRQPESSEIFFGVVNKKPTLFFSRDSKIFSIPVPTANEMFQSVVGFDKNSKIKAYWITSFGRVLSSNVTLPSDAEELAKNPLVKKFLSSSVATAVTQIEDGSVPFVGAFRVVSGTNSAIFIEIPYSEVYAPFRRILIITGLLGFLITALTIGTGMILFDRMWRPVAQVTQLTSQIADGNFDVKSNYRYQDEIAFIFLQIEKMAKRLKGREVMLIEAERKLNTEQNERLRLEQSIETARLVQNNLISDTNQLVLPPNVDVSAYYKSCDAVGGDWYGFRYEESSRLLFAFIGDVTGHGTGSALLTGVTSGCILGNLVYDRAFQKFNVSNPMSIEDRIICMRDALSDVIKEFGNGEYCLTMLILCLNVDTGDLWYHSAGHPSPLIIRDATPTIESLNDGTGDIIGLVKEGELSGQVGHTKLDDQQTLFCYTDGLKENPGPGGNVLRPAQFKAMIKGIARTNPSANEFKNRVTQHMDGFWQDTAPKDDVSFLVIKRKA